MAAVNSRRRPRPAWAAAMLALLLGLSSLTACNTMRGAGEDAENAGDAVKDAVN